MFPVFIHKYGIRNKNGGKESYGKVKHIEALIM